MSRNDRIVSGGFALVLVGALLQRAVSVFCLTRGVLAGLDGSTAWAWWVLAATLAAGFGTYLHRAGYAHARHITPEEHHG